MSYALYALPRLGCTQIFIHGLFFVLEIKAAYIITTSKLRKPKFEKLIEECSGIATGLERVRVCVWMREKERESKRN